MERFRYQTGKIYHGELSVNNSIDDTSDYIVEAPYFSYNGFIRTPHLFSIDINPTTNVVKMVNRIEELKIISIQTFNPYTTDFENNDMNDKNFKNKLKGENQVLKSTMVSS